MIYAGLVLALALLLPALFYALWRRSARFESAAARLALRSFLLAAAFAPVPVFPLGIGTYFVPAFLALAFYLVQPSSLEEEWAARALGLALTFVLGAWAVLFAAGAALAAARGRRGKAR